MPKHVSMLLYIHRNCMAHSPGSPPWLSHSAWTLNSCKGITTHLYGGQCLDLQCVCIIMLMHRNRVGTESCLWEKNPWAHWGAELESVLCLTVWFSTLPTAPPCLWLIIIIMYSFMCYSPNWSSQPVTEQRTKTQSKQTSVRVHTHTHRVNRILLEEGRFERWFEGCVFDAVDNFT